MTTDDIRDLLVEIKTKLDIALTNQADHETRLRALERSKWVAVGAAAAAGGITGRLAGML